MNNKKLRWIPYEEYKLQCELKEEQIRRVFTQLWMNYPKPSDLTVEEIMVEESEIDINNKDIIYV